MNLRLLQGILSLSILVCAQLAANNVSLAWQSMLKPKEAEKIEAPVEDVVVEQRPKEPVVEEDVVVSPEQLKPGVINTQDFIKYTVTPDAILKALNDELVAHFNLIGELHILPSERLMKRAVPDANWYVELVAPFPASLNSRMALRYRLTNGYESLPTETVTIRAEWWREAIVAQRLMRPGEMDTQLNSQIKKVNWLLYRGDLVEAETDLGSLELKSNWRSNEPLRWNQVKTRPAIENGAIVDVVASEGTLKITMRGVATESGNIGDLISVRNLQSRKEIQGVITNANTVLVAF